MLTYQDFLNFYFMNTNEFISQETEHLNKSALFELLQQFLHTIENCVFNPCYSETITLLTMKLHNAKY